MIFTFFQVNLFTLVTCVAEFVGGGVVPYYNIDVMRLFQVTADIRGTITTLAEVFKADKRSKKFISSFSLFSQILFVFSIFYYTVMILSTAKKEGCRKFCSDTGNLMDCGTVVLSILALCLYVARLLATHSVTKEISETRGNIYLRLSIVQLINRIYEYMVNKRTCTRPLQEIFFFF